MNLENNFLEKIEFSMKYIIRFSVFLFILFCSCIDKRQSELQQALLLSGENRTELEKVLKRYSIDPSDSLKYKAACFLILSLTMIPQVTDGQGLDLGNPEKITEIIYSPRNYDNYIKKEDRYELLMSDRQGMLNII